MKSGPSNLTEEEKRHLYGVGERIARLRRIQHLTQTELARRIGLRPGPLHAIEHGKSLPTLGIVTRLAKALGVQVATLLAESGVAYVREPETAVPYPDLADPAASPVRLLPGNEPLPESVLHEFEDLVHACLLLEDICQVPKRAAIPLRLAMPCTEQGIEDLASRVRGLLGIGPGVIFDYLELLENAGLRIVFCRLPPEIQSAACHDVANENAFIFVSNSKELNTERRLFRLILELGRIYCYTGGVVEVAGRAKALDAAHVAAKFTAFFLMPAEAVHATVRQVGLKPETWTWGVLLRLKHRFGVSAETFLYRLGELNLISPRLLADFKSRILAHYAATGNAEPDGSRRILTPNGRLGDLLLMARDTLSPARVKEIAALRRLLARHGVKEVMPAEWSVEEEDVLS